MMPRWHVALNLVLIPFFKFKGAAIATAMTTALGNLAMLGALA